MNDVKLSYFNLIFKLKLPVYIYSNVCNLLTCSVSKGTNLLRIYRMQINSKSNSTFQVRKVFRFAKYATTLKIIKSQLQ
jgi:hypothetical protein